jgi:hypothetical protein
MESEYDRYDWDTSDPRQHCRHGKFIGSWWGPDVLCGQCEYGQDPSINEMIEVYYNQIDRKYIESQAVTDFMMGYIKDESNDFDSEALTEAYFDFLKSKDDSIKKCRESIQATIDYYEQFTNDRNDRNVLYMAHRYNIQKYEESLKDREDSVHVEFD